MEVQKEYRHRSAGIEMSDELSKQEKEFIMAMQDRQEHIQIPMLTEKIMVLNKNIKKLTKATSCYSIILIVLTCILVVFSVITLIK